MIQVKQELARLNPQSSNLHNDAGVLGYNK
jgi:hypothetical protein